MTPERVGAGVRRAADRRRRSSRRARSTARFAPPIPTGSSKSIRSCAAPPIRGSSRRRSTLEDGAVAPPAGAVVLGGAVRSHRDRAPRGGVGASASRRRRSRWRGWRRRSSSASAKERRDRFEMVRFAQGVFGNIDGDRAVDALVALGGYRRYRAILLTLDRMDVADAARLRARRRSGPAARRGPVGPRREARGDRVSGGAGDPRARAADARRSTSPRAETLLLSLADAVDPPSDNARRGRSPPSRSGC